MTNCNSSFPMIEYNYITMDKGGFPMNIAKQAYAFRMDGQPVACIPHGHGHINSTFKIVTDTDKAYILQRINKYVFKNPIQVMANVQAVTEFLHKKIHDPKGALHLIPTLRNRYYHKDEDGEFWRMYDFMNGICLDTPQSDADFYESGLAFGRFQELLADFPASTLFETIPNFHNTPDRFQQLKKSIELDMVGRKEQAKPEILQAMAMEEMGCRLQKMLDDHVLPLRVTHNDTKLNNVMLDSKTRKALCVLDLDTVMPGLSVHDFGDSIRFGAATAAEDEQDASKMHLDLHLFEIYTKGFLEAAPSLTDEEVSALALGAFTMTLEVGIRFLKDYLDGDLYFRVAYENHNLIRCRTQLALAADMLKHWDEMNQIVARISSEIRTK